MDIRIRQAAVSDADLLANIISIANSDVAHKFNLTLDNSPKHPSFCTRDWILADFERGEIYFILELSGKAVGCIAYETPGDNNAYLNRLSVMPEFRQKGFGQTLIRHHLEYSKQQNIKSVSIGIIAAFTELKEWYIRLGFKENGIKQFPYLPCDVCFLNIFI